MTGMGVSGRRGNVPVGEGDRIASPDPGLCIYSEFWRGYTRAPPCLARGRAATTGTAEA